MTQYTLHKDQKKVHAVDHGYTPMHSPENFFRYMKQGMQTLCCGGCWDWGIVCGLCVVVVQSLSLLPHSTVLHKIGSKQSRGRLSFYTKTFLLAHGLQTSPKQNNSCKNTVHTCSFLMYCYTCCSAFYWAKIGTLQYFSRF